MVAAKTAVPRIASRHLSRPRLIEALASAGSRAILLSAPAGHGKTMLLAEWASDRRERVAWLTLDAGDDDAARFWAGVLAALCACPAVAADGPLHRLSVPAVPDDDPGFLGALDAALYALPATVTLVLDDLHELNRPDAVRAVGHLVRHRPDTVRLVLATRRDPALPLARLRLDGLLWDLRADSLVMRSDEAGAMLALADVDLRPDQVETLIAQTAGWVVGLRLAALSIAGAADPEEFLADLAGNSRAVADYLVTEILARMPAPTVAMLHAVSVCDQVDASLAAELSGIADAGDLLGELERDTALVASYGPGRASFRVHPLLRAHLRADLRRRRPDAVAGLHRRAAYWFLRNGGVADALAHLVAGGDPEATADLLRRRGVRLMEAGHHRSVAATLAALPSVRVAADPVLAVVAARRHLWCGELDAATAALERADRGWPRDAGPGPEADRSAVRARLELVRDRMFHPAGAGELSVVDGDDGPARLLRAAQAIARNRLETAQTLARSVLAEPADGVTRVRALSLLAAATGLRGGFATMAELAEQAESEAGRVPDGAWEGSESEALNAVLRGYAALLRADPAGCLRAVDCAEPFARRLGPAVALLPMIESLRGAARHDLGDRLAGLALLTRARAATVAERARDEQVALVALLEHSAALALGHRDDAHATLSWAASRLGETAEVRVMRAAGASAISRYDAARRHLAPVLDGSAALSVSWVAVDARLVGCAVALGAGRPEEADRSLASALQVAHEIGVLRPLVGAPYEVLARLSARLGAWGALDPFAREVLRLRGALSPVRGALGPVAVLTGREREVLAHLPSHRSLDEIAAQLGVSPNTVKTHVKAVYAKLGVTSRRSAVAAADGQGLTP